MEETRRTGQNITYFLGQSENGHQTRGIIDVKRSQIARGLENQAKDFRLG